MSTISRDTHVASLVLEQPGRARVFERFGIDYCCGGRKPLERACADRGVDVEAVLAALREQRPGESGEVNWAAASVADLCTHIVGEHHAYLRDELPSLGALVEKVARVHGAAHPELEDVRATFGELAAELEQHMDKEESVLFPACVALADGADADFPFGSVGNPIRMMVHEHDRVAEGLARLRATTNAYEPPAGACNSYRSMLDRLETLEADTHRHVYEENNVLFPRAVALEAAR